VSEENITTWIIEQLEVRDAEASVLSLIPTLDRAQTYERGSRELMTRDSRSFRISTSVCLGSSLSLTVTWMV